MMRVLLAVVLFLGGCRLAPPAGFVALPCADEELLAVAPSGSRMRVCQHRNHEGGTLPFWSAAVTRELTGGRGYTLVESTPCTAASGLAGTELRFRAEQELVPWHYLVAVFVDGKRLLVADAGGEAAAFERELPAVRAALRELR